jgi:antitoxin component of MazEF toxin-antitoxin module
MDVLRRPSVQTRIQKWGNNFMLRIPLKIAKQLQLHPDSLVSLEVENGKVVIQPAKYDLNLMLKEITQKNRHYQIFDDD